MTTSISRIQAYDLVMCRYFCIGFIDSVPTQKILIDFINLFLPNSFKDNDEVILNKIKNGSSVEYVSKFR